MKLVVQIPCFNEGECISEVLKSIPASVRGVDIIKVVVIDDGSSDKTSNIALEFGVDLIKIKKNKGLSNAFNSGVKYALLNKADILVNLDGDNQYKASDIEKLIQPILLNKADVVIGARDIKKIKTFSLFKKIMQYFGSFVVRTITDTDVKDAPSGFRAYNREALLNLNIFNSFSYTIESIIQLREKKLIVENIDIEVNEQKKRKSKLFKNNFEYIFKQAKTILRFFIIYKPAKFFLISAFCLLLIGLLIGFRFLYFYFNHNGFGHIQSLILCAIILILSFFCFLCAIIGDLFSINRKLLEGIEYEIKIEKYGK